MQNSGTHYDALIVGAGHGGAATAAALRQAQFNGSVALLGDEPHLPYERPPLSKEYLAGDITADRLLSRSAASWADRNVTILTGRRVNAIDTSLRRVACENGGTLSYDHLIWAAGGAPRRLSCGGRDLAGVHTIRTLADVDQLRAELGETTRVVVVGAGYIGLEAAATLTKAGKNITVLETLDRVLPRVAGAALSRFYESEHRARGVNIRLRETVVAIEGRNGRVSGVKLDNGERLECEMVIVGIGIVPLVAPLIEAGARGQNGVEIDEQCRTNLPRVFAIGDCALHTNRYAGGRIIRLESVQNANDQAAVVAKVLTGRDATYDSVPWFWSNQYDLKLQTIGLSLDHDHSVLRGNTATRSFSVVYLKQGKVIALDCVNSAKDYAQGKRLIAAGMKVPPDLLADAATPLKEM